MPLEKTPYMPFQCDNCIHASRRICLQPFCGGQTCPAAVTDQNLYRQIFIDYPSGGKHPRERCHEILINNEEPFGILLGVNIFYVGYYTTIDKNRSNMASETKSLSPSY